MLFENRNFFLQRSKHSMIILPVPKAYHEETFIRTEDRQLFQDELETIILPKTQVSFAGFDFGTQ